MISSFQSPKSWAKMVNLELEKRKSAKTIDTATYSKLKLAVEPLGRSVAARGEKFLPNHSRRKSYDGNESWIDNAIAADTVSKFTCILSEGTPPSVALNDYDFGDPDLSCPSHVFVPRNEIDLIKSIRTLLEVSNQVIFVDPYFDPKFRRFQVVPRQVINDFPYINYIRIVTQDGSQKSTSSKSITITDFSNWSSGNTPLDVFILKDKPDSEQFHARYILTDAGGVMVDPGIDIGSIPGDNFKVTRLDAISYRMAWSWYVNLEGFETVTNFNINV